MPRAKNAAKPPAKSARDRQLPKYSIAVASDLSGVPQQQLRRMEDGGLVAPQRTGGNTRRYSDADIERISEVTQLAEDGVNSAGIRHILALRAEMDILRDDLASLRQEIDALRRETAAHASTGTTNTNTPPSTPPAGNQTRPAHRTASTTPE